MDGGQKGLGRLGPRPPLSLPRGCNGRFFVCRPPIRGAIQCARLAFWTSMPAAPSVDPLAALLRNDRFIVLDGGLATALESLGYDLNHALWSAKLLRDEPDAIRTVHRDYFLAGADVAITASYQASVSGLQQHFGLDLEQAKQLIRESVRLAAQARDEVASQAPERTLLVAGSVGPYGAYLANGAEYTGDYGAVTLKELRTFHHTRIAALLEAGADLLACETIPSLGEAKVLAELLREEFPACRAWLSCTLRDAEHISDGTSVLEVVEALKGCDQIVSIGFNCIPLDLASEALTQLRPLTDKPLTIYPNSGEKWDGMKKQWYGGAAALENLPAIVQKWYHSGARLIGGCCRMGFEDIRVISNACRIESRAGEST